MYLHYTEKNYKRISIFLFVFTSLRFPEIHAYWLPGYLTLNTLSGAGNGNLTRPKR